MKLTVYVCFREDRSEELRKVHESKMLYLNKTQTDKVEKIQLLIQHFLHLKYLHPYCHIFFNVHISNDLLYGKRHVNIAICRQRKN